MFDLLLRGIAPHNKPVTVEPLSLGIHLFGNNWFY
jgi:hypothetical protein